jgi:hypothetical protein
VTAPAPRTGRPAPTPREILSEIAGILATGYLRARGVRLNEASALATLPVAEAKALEVPAHRSVSRVTPAASAEGRTGASR